MKKGRLMRGMMILLMLAVNTPAMCFAQCKPSFGHGSYPWGVASEFGKEIVVGEISATFGKEIKVGEISSSFGSEWYL